MLQILTKSGNWKSVDSGFLYNQISAKLKEETNSTIHQISDGITNVEILRIENFDLFTVAYCLQWDQETPMLRFVVYGLPLARDLESVEIGLLNQIRQKLAMFMFPANLYISAF